METALIDEAELSPEVESFLETLITKEEKRIKNVIKYYEEKDRTTASVIGCKEAPYHSIQNHFYSQLEMHTKSLIFLGQVYDKMYNSGIPEYTNHDADDISTRFEELKHGVAEMLWQFKHNPDTDYEYISRANIRYGKITLDGNCIARNIRNAHRLGLATSKIPKTTELDSKYKKLTQRLERAKQDHPEINNSAIKSQISGINLTPVFYEAEITEFGEEIYQAALKAGVDSYIKKEFRL